MMAMIVMIHKCMEYKHYSSAEYLIYTASLKSSKPVLLGQGHGGSEPPGLRAFNLTFRCYDEGNVHGVARDHGYAVQATYR